MGLDKYPTLFRTLRLLTILVTFAIIVLEIMQHKTLSLYTQNYELPAKDYQDIKSNLYGIKIFFYVVMVITIIFTSIQFFKFNTLWREGPFVRDVVFGACFAILWIIAGLTNVYVYYYAPEMICPGYSKSEILWELQLKCRSYLSNTALAWLNVLIFLLSTILYWKLWTDKRNNSNQTGNPNQHRVILMAQV